MGKAYSQFNEALGAGDQEKLLSALKWAELAIKAGDRHKKLTETKDEDVLDSIQYKLKPRHIDDIPTKDDLDIA